MKFLKYFYGNSYARLKISHLSCHIIVKNIVKASIGTGVTAFGLKVFMGSTLSEITIPNSVTDIGELALAACKSLKSVTIPNSVTSIGKDVFYKCNSLTSITFYGKTMDEVKAMNYYPWGIQDMSIITNTDRA